MKRIAVNVLVAVFGLSCATTGGGTLGHGEVHTRVEMGVAGLTLSEQQLIERGPGAISLAAVHQMVPRDAVMLLRLDLVPLVSSGLAPVMLEALPTSTRQGWDRVVAASGIDPINDMDGVGWWALGGSLQDDSWTTAYMTIVAPRTAALNVLSFSAALEKELGDEDRNDGRAWEVVIAAPVPERDLAAVVEQTGMDVKEVKRLNLADRVVLLSGQDGELLFYACVWPGGILAGATPSFDGNMQDAAARKAYESMNNLAEAVAAARVVPAGLPTIEIKAIFDGKPHHLQAIVDTVVSVSYETASDAFGPSERVLSMVQNWERDREMALRVVEAGAFGASSEARKALFRQLIENAALSETGMGVRAETEADVDLFIDALRDIAP